MESSKYLAMRLGSPAAADYLPYSRLVLHVACMAIGGWMLLDMHGAVAAVLG